MLVLPQLYSKRPYIGRFAPSPTGPLHFGSLLTALASYCDAKAHHGRWLIRIEDSDTTRLNLDYENNILKTLAYFGFESDGPILFQRQRTAHYENALDRLNQQSLIYACQCSRKNISGMRYRGYCRDLNLPFEHHAIRLSVPNGFIGFDDLKQHIHYSNVYKEVGDFVLKRRDGIITYQLAVVIDDFEQGVTHVIRGLDLLDNTPRQLWLMRCLGFPPPLYLHLPLAMNNQGQKLSKQNLALALDHHRAPELLAQAADALGQPALDIDTPDRMLAQAVAQWQRSAIPRTILKTYQ